jgi:hypothetical protein
MAFGDQIYRQTKLTEPGNAMNAKQVLSNCLSIVTPTMHKIRRQSRAGLYFGWFLTKQYLSPEFGIPVGSL